MRFGAAIAIERYGRVLQGRVEIEVSFLAILPVPPVLPMLEPFTVSNPSDAVHVVREASVATLQSMLGINSKSVG